MKAGKRLRSVVRLHRVNLCRNVLIYFDGPSKARVVGRLLDRLEPAGYLLLGHAETVTGLGARARTVGPTAYAHARPPAAVPAAR